VVAIVAIVAVLASTHRVTTAQIIVFCVLIPSIILHEVSHGWVALAFGDDTAKRAGRLSLNPLRHVDPVGTVILPALMVLSGIGFFGYAKPVPVNLSKLRHPRNEGVLVSLAGPLTNLLLAVAAAFVLRRFALAELTAGGPLPLWVEVLFYLGLGNVWLAVFNMIPIPPLDGSVLLERLLPRSWWPGYLRIRPYTMPILIALVVLSLTFPSLGVLSRLSTLTYGWWLDMLRL